MTGYGPIVLECLGVAAGTLVATSAIKRAVDAGRDARVALGESLLRNGMQLAGNALWLLYGAISGRWALILSAAVACSILTYLVYCTMRARQA